MKAGAFKLANTGTLFLDEIAEIPIDLQAKLLRAIEYHEIKSVGSDNPVKVDLKIIFATNRDLPTEVRIGRFREDLFYRINTPAIVIPPLRERSEDIPLLSNHYREYFNKEFRTAIKSISSELLFKLKTSQWQGNVRDLRNVIKRAVMNNSGDELVENENFSGSLENSPNTVAKIQRTKPKSKIEQYMETERIVAKCDGNISEASRILGIDRTTVHRHLKRLEDLRTQ